GAVWGALTNSGQVCMSTERIYVEAPILEKFSEQLKKEVAQLHRENGTDSDLGSMTFAPQLKIIRQQVEDALSKGAHLLYDPKPQDWPQREGLHLTPIILTNVTHDMKVMQEE